MPLPLIPILGGAAMTALRSVGTMVARNAVTKIPGSATTSKLVSKGKNVVKSGQKVVERGRKVKRAGEKVMDFFEKRNVEEAADEAMGEGGTQDYLASLPGMSRSDEEGDGFISAMNAIAMSTMSGREEGDAQFPVVVSEDADFQEPVVLTVIDRLNIVERRLDDQNKVLSSIKAVIADGVEQSESENLRRRREDQEEEAEAKKGLLNSMGMKAKDFVGAAALTAAVPLIDKATNIVGAGAVMAAGYVAGGVSKALGFMQGEDRAATPKEIAEEYGEGASNVDIIQQATDGFGTDENAIIYAMQQIKTQEELNQLKKDYEEKYGETLDAVLKSELGKDEYKALMVQLRNQFVNEQQKQKGLELTKEVKSYVSDDYLKENYSDGVGEEQLDQALFRAEFLDEEKGVLARILTDINSVKEFQDIIVRYNERTGKDLVAELKEKLGRQEYYRLRDNIVIREKNGMGAVQETIEPIMDQIEPANIETAEPAETMQAETVVEDQGMFSRFKNNVSVIYNHYFGGDEGNQLDTETQKQIEVITEAPDNLQTIVQQTFEGDTNIENVSQIMAAAEGQDAVLEPVTNEYTTVQGDQVVKNIVTQQTIIQQERESGVRDPRPLARETVAPIMTQVVEGDNIINQPQTIVPDTDFFGGVFDSLRSGIGEATALSGDALRLGRGLASKLVEYSPLNVAAQTGKTIVDVGQNAIGSLRDALPLPENITQTIVEKIPQIISAPTNMIVDRLGSTDILSSVGDKIGSALDQFQQGRAGILRKISGIAMGPTNMITELITNQVTQVAPASIGDQITNIFGGDTNIVEQLTQGGDNILNETITNVFGADTPVSQVIQQIKQGDTNIFETLAGDTIENTTIKEIFSEVQNLTTEKTRIIETIKEQFMDVDLEALESKKIIPLVMNMPVEKRKRSIGQADAAQGGSEKTFARPTRSVRDSFVTVGYQQ